MVHDSSFSSFPFIDTEADEDHESDDQCAYNTCIGPSVKTATEIEANQEEGQTCSQETKSRQVEVTQLLDECQVIKSSMSFRGSVSNEYAYRSQSP